MRSLRGYSLIELVLMLVIAGILAAIAIPQFNEPQIDASWFQEQVKAALRYAQRQAVAQRRTVFVVVSANGIQLCYDSGNPTCPSPVSDFATGSAYAKAAPTGVALTPQVFSFNALGQPSAGGPFVVGTTTVEADTGYVH
jgi:MSHA pilin protein MshC